MDNIVLNLGSNNRDYCELKVSDFEALHKVHVTIHDLKGVLSYQDGVPFFRKRSSHQHPFCLKGRSKRIYDKRCVDHCQSYMHGVVKENPNPFSHKCWKRCRELVVPVQHENILLFVLYAGAFREKEEKELPGLYFQKSYAQLEFYEEENILTLTRSLESLGSFLLQYIQKIKRMNVEKDRKLFIKEFIFYKAHEEISLGELADALFLSRSRTSHLVKELFDDSFQDLLAKERIDRAKNLLISTPYPLIRISKMIGLKNEYYFNRLFKRIEGVSPGRYRKQINSIEIGL